MAKIGENGTEIVPVQIYEKYRKFKNYFKFFFNE